MAHFAKIDENNIVVQVVVVSNDVATDEQAGITFLQNLYKNTATWKQTSYNNNIRKNFAGIGYTYDSSKDAFISAQPYSSWTLNNDTCRWEAPVAYPDDDKQYRWNEDTTSWDAV
jgi:hypothetical protein|tara:strand:+ start:274 stop:618 length:345 start_codon:yes stop_codon:yes gene_type:complete